jgi:hypothetical protein
VLKKCDGEARGCQSTFFSDGESSDRDASWHLGDGKEGVESAEGFARDGNSEDGERGNGCDHTREMGSASSACEDHSEAAFFSGACVGEKTLGSSMGADHADLGGDACLPEKILGGSEGGPVGATAHKDGDDWVLTFQDVKA